MTLHEAAAMVRRINPDGGRRLEAIRFLRGLGLTFATARTMVLEIQDGKRWWKARGR